MLDQAAAETTAPAARQERQMVYAMTSITRNWSGRDAQGYSCAELGIFDASRARPKRL